MTAKTTASAKARLGRDPRHPASTLRPRVDHLPLILEGGHSDAMARCRTAMWRDCGRRSDDHSAYDPVSARDQAVVGPCSTTTRDDRAAAAVRVYFRQGVRPKKRLSAV